MVRPQHRITSIRCTSGATAIAASDFSVIDTDLRIAET